MAEVFQLVIEIDGRKVPAQARAVGRGMESIEAAASKASSRVEGMSKATRAALGNLGSDVGRLASGGFKSLDTGIQSLANSFNGLIASVKTAGKGIGGLFAAIGPTGWMIAGFAALMAVLGAAKGRWDEYRESVKEAEEAMQAAAKSLDDMRLGALNASDAAIEAQAEILAEAEAAARATLAHIELNRARQAFGRSFLGGLLTRFIDKETESYEEQLRVINEIVASLNRAITENEGRKGLLKDIEDQIKAHRTLASEYQKQLDAHTRAVKERRDAEREIVGIIERQLELAREGERLAQSFPSFGAGPFRPDEMEMLGPGGLVDLLTHEWLLMNRVVTQDLTEQQLAMIDEITEEYHRKIAPGFGRGFGRGFGQSFAQNMAFVATGLAHDFVQAIVNSDLDNFFDNLGKRLASQVAAAATDAALNGLANAAGSAGAYAGIALFATAFIAGTISVFKQLSDRGVSSGLKAEVTAFSGAVSIFTNSIMTFRDAAILIAEAQRSVNAKLNDLFGGIGGFMFSPGSQEFSGFGNGGGPGGGSAGGGNDDDAIAFADRLKIPLFNILDGLNDFFLFIEEKGGQWIVAIRGIAAGFGDSVEAAIEDLMNTFVQRLPALIEQGLIVLTHVPDALVEVLKNSGAQTFDQLKEALEVATRVFMQSLGPIEADLFAFFNKLATDIQEAIRVGLPKDVARDAIRNQIQGFISQVAGVDLFPQFANVEAIMEQFRMQLERLGITGKEQVKLLKQMELATDLYNRSLEVDVLGQLADMARQFGLAAEFVREVEIARVRIQFAILKAQLISLELWKKFKDIWKLVRDHALDAARSMDSAARSASGIGRSLGGGGGAAVPTVRVSGTVPVDVVSESFQNEDRLATFRTALRSFMGRFADAARDPVQQLLLDFQDVIDKIERIRQDSRRDIAMAEATRAFQQALTMILEGLKSELQKFRDSLESTILGGGTRRERAMNALGSFQDLLTRAMGGDLSAFQQLQEAADLALRLGQEAFGTSTDDFRAIFDIVTGGLDQILGMDFMDLFGNVDPFGESDSLSALQSSVDLQTSALIAELEESRRDQANRMNAQTRVLEQINARLAGSSSGPPI